LDCGGSVDFVLKKIRGKKSQRQREMEGKGREGNEMIDHAEGICCGVSACGWVLPWELHLSIYGSLRETGSYEV